MTKIAFLNPKGGVGKTTCVINMGSGFARLGKRVLLLDLDPQEHLTYSLGLEGKPKGTIVDILQGYRNFEDVVVKRGELEVIPGSTLLEELEMKMAYIKKNDLLKNSMKFVQEYDFILIDCPPNLNILSRNAMVYTDEIYVPVQSEFLALQGMARIDNMVKSIKRKYNKHLIITGLIATRFDHRRNLNKDVVSTIKEFYGDKLFNTTISDNIDIAVAPSYRKTIFEYKPHSKGAEDYLNLCKEALNRCKKNGKKHNLKKRPESFIELVKVELEKRNKKDNSIS